MRSLHLTLLDGLFSVCRLPAGTRLPRWFLEVLDCDSTPLCSITRTGEEISLLIPQQSVPAEIRREDGWRAIQVAGPLEFSMTGVLASLAGPLADAQVSLFATSTYDTDYLLVKADRLDRALLALTDAGHHVESGHRSPT